MTQILMSRRSIYLLALAAVLASPSLAIGSSHKDAPLITLDDAAKTTDVYAFVSRHNGMKHLTTALAVYPFEEPGIGPNKYNFDDNVRYEIHVLTGNDVSSGRTSMSYRLTFESEFQNPSTILQSYLGVVEQNGDAAQNFVQRYRVNKLDHRGRSQPVNTLLGTGIVPPNNQGIATPYYNRGNNGENFAREGVSSESALDRYTSGAIAELAFGYRAFAGQRDDGFYGDIQAVFDLLQLRNPGVDAQAGYNVHTIVLEIPLADIGGEDQVVGVYATTSRRAVTVAATARETLSAPRFVQVARQGNPLFNEALVAVTDKDTYSRTRPTADRRLFRKYAVNPELATLLNALVLEPDAPGIDSNRQDLAGIFIPDVIKVDVSTPPARLAGGGLDHPSTPDDPGFSRLSVFGGDTLFSALQGAEVAGGWPNGRRFGDDVVDIAVTAVISDLTAGIVRGPAGDNVDANDVVYNKVFPYAATPLNGRRHRHPGH